MLKFKLILLIYISDKERTNLNMRTNFDTSMGKVDT